MKTTAAAGGFKVVYLGHLARRAYAGTHPTLDGAVKELRSYKRQGRTVWVETADGVFVPVQGAKRKPAEL